jgi:HTH-type transcriptional regulator / antitoxin HigA
LSLRYKTSDQFWFTFFHEAAHILKHPRKSEFLDFEKLEASQEEDEANQFAADTLIPPTALRKFLAGSKLTEAYVLEFAAEIDIEPGIIVGRLQHDYVIPFSRFNRLKTTLQWVENK